MPPDLAPEDLALLRRVVMHRLAQSDLAGLGLTQPALEALLSCTRLVVAAAQQPGPGTALFPAGHLAFMQEAHALLWRSREGDAPATRWLARIVACACLRPDHLWRDLGLDGRDDVSALLQRHFPRLVARNTQQLRWKKFIALEVAAAAGQPSTALAHAPGCPACEDFGHCYPAGVQDARAAGR